MWFFQTFLMANSCLHAKNQIKSDHNSKKEKIANTRVVIPTLKKKENSEYKRVVITTLKKEKRKNSQYKRVVITTLNN